MIQPIYTIITAIIFVNCQLLSFNCQGQANEPGSGNALSFDGIDDRVDFPNAIDLGNNNDFTIEMWFMLNDNSTTSYLFTQANTANNVQLLTIETTGTALDFHFRDNNWNIAILSTIQNPPTGIWHHVTVVRKAADDFEMYLNGILQDTNNTLVGTATFDTYHLGVLERLSGLTRWFPGYVDEVRIWRALTQTELRQNMTKKLTGNENGLVGYWCMDEGSGNTAFDSSPSGNDGTLN